MLDKNKVAEKLAEKSSTTETPVGGPPGTKKVTNGEHKVNKPVQKQLAKLIQSVPGMTATAPEAPPVQAAVKPSSKKAIKWLIKKLGEKGANEMATGNGLSLKKYALAMYTEHLAAKEAKEAKKAEEPKNDAMQAIVNGAVKKRAKKQEAEAASRDKAIDGAILSLKVSTDEQLKNALHGFIDGPLKNVMERFVSLYVSRTDDGESDEAVLALDACREAFDACGLLLADVKTEGKKKAPIAKVAANDAEAAVVKQIGTLPKSKQRKSGFSEKKSERVRKPLTKEQREAKNKKDRERRAAKAKKGSK